MTGVQFGSLTTLIDDIDDVRGAYYSLGLMMHSGINVLSTKCLFRRKSLVQSSGLFLSKFIPDGDC